MAWTDSILNLSLRNGAIAAIADGRIDYPDILGLLNAAASGGVVAEELADLRWIYVNGQASFSSDYLRAITSDVLYGNPGNARWWGGAQSLAGVSPLGDLAAGSSELNAQRLVGKWFLGTDWPMPVAGGDTATGQASTSVFSYTLAKGALFVDGATASDIYQGSTGDCYLMAALGAIANRKPSVIADMFIANPNGTYGVNFYSGGTNVYVTVDTNLATLADGRLALAGNATRSTSGELWLPLAEKAYTQLNTQFNVDNKKDWTGENSYQAVEGGWAQAINQVANLNYRYYSSYWSGIPDSYDSGEFFSSNAATYKQTIITGLQAGAIGWLGSFGTTKGANGKTDLVSGHAFMLLGYNAATDKFILRNPWGGDGSGSWNVQFEVSIETFWNPTVKGVVALSDATAADPSYLYGISTAASSSAAAVTEGQTVTFTISRNASGTSSTVYISTVAGSAGTADYQALNKLPVTFAANELLRTVTVSSLQDGLTEGVENFSAAVFLKSADTASVATATAYLKDAAVTAYSYTLVSSAADSAGAVFEGGSISFTITRSGTGSESTVYLSTVAGTAGNLDYAGLDRQALTFSAFESVKTVQVKPLLDALSEGTENFSLALFRNYTDSAAASQAVAYIKDAVEPVYDYTITSDADSAGAAMAEGGKVTFSIVRSGSGTASTVWLSTVPGSAGGADYVALDKKALVFAANQTVATLQVGISEDWWLEAVEYFRLGLYKNLVDTSPASYGSAYIKDAPVSTYNYTVASNADTAAAALTEGSTASFTITRSGTGTASTVYVSTASGSADNGADQASLDRQAVTFAAFETSKTVSVATYQDALAEGTEYFWFNLYRNYADPAASASNRAYIKDPAVVTNYSYTLASSAAGSDAAVVEGSPVTFTITRSGSGTASTVYVDTNTANGSATGDVDYASLTRVPVTFAAFETSKTVTVNTYQDSTAEGSEYFYLLLFKSYADPFSAYAAYTTGYIKDPVAAVNYSYALSTAAGSSANAVAEGSPVTFTITRSSSGTASIVYVGTSPGTADTGGDVEAVNRKAVEFAAFETTKSFTVATYQDNRVEGAEYFWFDLYKNLTDTSVSATVSAYVKDPVVANYSYTLSTAAGSAASAVTEGSPITFTITRSGSGSASTVYVDTNTSNESATGDVDYRSLDRLVVSFAANETSRTVSVDTFQDSLTEGSEYLYLLLFKNLNDAFADYAGYTAAYIKDPAVTIDYSYALSTVAGSAATAVVEGSPLTFTITRSGSGSASTVYVDTNTSNGSATGGVDYRGLTRQAVNFAADETSRTVNVETFQDSLTEGSEYLYLLLFKNYNDAFSDYATYTTGYIKDPAVAVNYSYTLSSAASSAATAVVEGSPISFTITRSGSGSASTVYVDTNTSNGSATGDVDYRSLTRQAVNFAANETSKTVTVETLQDSLTEGSEYLYLLLFKNLNDAFADYAAYTTGYIKDPAVAVNYSYTLSTSASSSATAVVEGSPVSFTITRSGSGSASTVYVDTNATNASATGGVDHEILNRQAVNFAANETSKTVTVNTYPDSLVEGAESFYLLLYKSLSDAASAYATYAMGYVKDPAVANYTYSVSSTAGSSATAVSEGSPATFTVTRSGSGSVSTIYIDTNTGNATAGASDYAIINRQALTFAANETSKTVTVNTFKDSLVENPEFFYLLLYKTADAPFSEYLSFATAYIRDAQGAFVEPELSAALALDAPGATGAATSPAPVSAFPGHTLGEYRNATSFAALRADGAVIAWGDKAHGGDAGAAAKALDGTNPVSQIYSNPGAFAAVRADGSVVAWGSAQQGGAMPAAAAAQLDGSIDVTRIYATQSAFAALRADGSLVSWGDANFGGDSGAVAAAVNGSVDVQQVASNSSAFAALRVDGSVVTWGYAGYGGDSSAVARALNGAVAVQQVYASSSAFAALRTDGSLVTWGNASGGGSSASVAAALDGSVDVMRVASTTSAFAALRSDGSVVSWGDSGFGGDSSAVAAALAGDIDTVSLASTSGAFAALRSDGSVVTWGYGSFGGNSVAVAGALSGANPVLSLFANKTAFAALRADGSLVTWGVAGQGGDSSAVATALDGSVDVVQVYATDSAFAALRSDGSVVVWGDALAGGDAGAVQAQLNGSVRVKEVYANGVAFSALRADGTMVTWGDFLAGGDSTAVKGQLVSLVGGASILSSDDYSFKPVYSGTAAADLLLGSAANDVFTGFAGDDAIYGGAGRDLAVYAAPRAAATLHRTSAGWTVSSAADGNDLLGNIERLRFADSELALDLEGAAGQVAKILGAVFGTEAVKNKVYAGIGLKLLDSGVSYADLVTLAINTEAFLSLAGSSSNAALVKLLYTNVVGVAPSQAELNGFVGLLDTGAYTRSGLALFACETDINQAHINLAGLAEVGLDYVS